MLDDDDVVIVGLQAADELGAPDALLDIEVGGGLIEDIDLYLLDHHDQHGETLQLTTRQLVDITSVQLVQLQILAELIAEIQHVLLFNVLADIALGGFGDTVDVLRFYGRFKGQF